MAPDKQQLDGGAAAKVVSLDERLNQIRSMPKLQNQQQTALVLSAVDDTLKEQKSERTPTAYFAALLSLLSSNGAQGKDVAATVVYLLDLVTPHVPQPLLRSKFTLIFETLAPALMRGDADAPFLRSAIGCLESLLVVQDAQAWALPQSQTGPRRAVAGLLQIAMDPRPKVRKRATEALTSVLQHGPPGPSIDHPAADMCAETALRSFQTLATPAAQPKKTKTSPETQAHDPGLIHSLQLIKTIAAATGGWPSKSLESLCEVLFTVAKSKSEFLTMAAFDVFEAIFEGMAANNSFSRLPRLLEAVSELRPSQEDSQLLPPWLAVISRGYGVSAQVEPEETFQQLPELFSMISSFLASSSHNIRVSAAECLISMLISCVPVSVIVEPTIYDEKTLEKICNRITELLSVKYQSSWMEVFDVVGAALEAFRWRSSPGMNKAVAVIGELRANESFSGKQKADEVIHKAIRAMGPEAVLEILPLNLVSPKPGQAGRAWMLPLMRDSVRNTNLSHFRTELLPLSDKMSSKIQDQKAAQKSMEAKIFETVIKQIWAILPGYCDGALDICQAFDQVFAQLLAERLYNQPDMRNLICKSLQNLVDSNKMISEMEGEENLLAQGRISRADAKLNLEHLATFAPNLVAVLFNVYTETATQYRGPVLACIDSYLSIIADAELSQTFDRVATELNNAIQQETADRAAQVGKPAAKDTKTPLSHALMDIIVTIAIYLPHTSLESLFTAASLMIGQKQDAQLQKKAYKLIPRLAQSSNGKAAVIARNADLQQLLLSNAEHVMIPAKRDRLSALAEVVDSLPDTELHFIPSIISEVILDTKETNERARQAAFDLIVNMGTKMATGGSIDHSRINGGTGGAPNVHPASIDEFAVMLSAGLAGTTPHMISATVTALSLILFHFKAQLSETSIADMVQTMDLFLSSPSREIVRSVLGFVKVCIISLPIPFMKPRLQTLVPSLMNWGKEHKAQFKVKVKNILERMIRRFGVEIVERYCPEEDKKLITNIRKTRDRNKKKKAADKEAGDGDDEEDEPQAGRKGKFENEFDEAIYGSDEDDANDEDADDMEVDGDSHIRGTGKKAGRDQQYIVDDADEPLDLLDRKALAHISSTRPVKAPTVPTTKRKVKTDVESGKLLFREGDSDSDADMADLDGPGGVSLEQGIDAYVAAIKGRDAPVRGQRNKLKFTNKRDKGGDDEEEEAEAIKETVRAVADRGGRGGMSRGRAGRGDRGGMRGGGRGDRDRGGRGGRSGRGGARGGAQSERRPLGADKTRGGRIEKSGGGGGSRGRGRGRGGSFSRR